MPKSPPPPAFNRLPLYLPGNTAENNRRWLHRNGLPSTHELALFNDKKLGDHEQTSGDGVLRVKALKAIIQVG